MSVYSQAQGNSTKGLTAQYMHYYVISTGQPTLYNI